MDPASQDTARAVQTYRLSGLFCAPQGSSAVSQFYSGVADDESAQIGGTGRSRAYEVLGTRGLQPPPALYGTTFPKIGWRGRIRTYGLRVNSSLHCLCATRQQTVSDVNAIPDCQAMLAERSAEVKIYRRRLMTEYRHNTRPPTTATPAA